MYELIQTGNRSFYINCPAKIGVFRIDGSRICLIDSGSDKDAGRKVRQIMDREGWSLHAIINTHSNADHIGGNKYLQQQTGCKIYAKGVEAAFTSHPQLEPAFLYGGYPFKDLRHKFLMAPESQVCDISAMAEDAALSELELIPLPGHFFEMIGVRTPDQTVFLADCLSSRATLDKYKVSFIYDVSSYLQTLDRVMEMDAPLFVPAHAEATDSIKDLAMYNKQCVHEIALKLLDICTTPQIFESVLKTVFDDYGLTMTFQQHVLVGSTIRSYLSWLKDEGRLTAYVEGNRMFWSVSDE